METWRVIVVEAADRGEIARAVERNSEFIREEEAVRDGVLVDIAAVVELAPFLREDGVDESAGVDAVLAH